MAAIREFEERANDLYLRALMPGLTHLYQGEEAVAVGICEALRPDDYITSTHRGHGHCLAKGATPDLMFAELLGKEAGYCKGKGGSMHIADPATGNLGANAIVGGSAGNRHGGGVCLKAAGQRARLHLLLRRGRAGPGRALRSDEHRVAVEAAGHLRLRKQHVQRVHALLGDHGGRGAGAAGGVWDSGRGVDGQDVRGVYATASAFIERARQGKGPGFMLCNTYRYRGHHVGDINRDYYRTKEEEQEWMKTRDPIQLLAKWLIGEGLADQAKLDRIETEVKTEMEAAVDFAIAAPYPVVSEVTRTCMPETETQVRELTLGEAVHEALAEEMRRDPLVVVMGEDVAEAGTPFKVLTGLVEEFGKDRVIDTPISEPGFTGIGVGAAMTGLRPVVDIMFGDFMTLIMDQIVNQAAKVHYMSGGKWKVPMVLRTTMGGARRSAAQHSQSLHAWPSHVPGLKVVMPSTPYDAKGLMKTAIRDDNPVVIFEDKMMYTLKGPVPTEEYTIPFGVADIKRPGATSPSWPPAAWCKWRWRRRRCSRRSASAPK